MVPEMSVVGVVQSNCSATTCTGVGPDVATYWSSSVAAELSVLPPVPIPQDVPAIWTFCVVPGPYTLPGVSDDPRNVKDPPLAEFPPAPNVMHNGPLAWLQLSVVEYRGDVVVNEYTL